MDIKNEFLWEDFVRNISSGGFYEFEYENIEIWVIPTYKKNSHKIEKWVFTASTDNGLKERDIYAEFLSVDLLLENARVKGKSLKEIWNSIRLIG